MTEYPHRGDAELRLALRGLRREITPNHDLWPGIAARLPPQAVTLAPRWRVWPWAVAASLALAVGLLGQGAPTAVRPVDVASLTTPSTPQDALPAVAQTLEVRSQAALRAVDDHAVSASWQPGLQALDQGAAQIQAALRQHPDSSLLLGQLRQIYLRKIALSRRALFV